jgi:energy-coupling factor transport system permease protein
VILSVSRNPLYLLLVMLVLQIVNSWLKLQPSGSRISIPFTFVIIIIAGATVFNALTSHFGATVLFTIPGQIPLLSGPVTLESVVYGAINGMILAGMLLAFTVFNRALTVRSLIKLIPQAFSSIAVIVAIGITFLPITLRQFHQVREAQAIRGHKLRGLKDWLPLVMPLLTGGLERAMHLAEAMTARGFASETTQQNINTERSFLVISLLLFVTGWLMWISPIHPAFGVGMLLAAGSGFIWSLLAVGRKTKRTTYKNQPWRWADFLIISGALTTFALFVLLPLVSQQYTTQYNPYPAVSLPDFDVWVGISLFGLLVPVLGSAIIKRNDNFS